MDSNQCPSCSIKDEEIKRLKKQIEEKVQSTKSKDDDWDLGTRQCDANSKEDCESCQ